VNHVDFTCRVQSDKIQIMSSDLAGLVGPKPIYVNLRRYCNLTYFEDVKMQVTDLGHQWADIGRLRNKPDLR
jgi:hypothetical protein